MEEIKVRHSKLKIIGGILFFGGAIVASLNAVITNDINIGIPIIAGMALGGMLMMVGLLNETMM